MLKRIFTTFILFILIFSFTIPCLVYADDASVKAKQADDIARSIESRANYWVLKSSNTISGDVGALTNAQYIMYLSMWVEFLAKDSKIAISQYTREHFVDQVVSISNRYNIAFEDMSPKLGTTDGVKFSFATTIGGVHDLLVKRLDVHNKAYSSSESKPEYIKSAEAELRVIYSIIEGCNTELNLIDSYSESSIVSDGVLDVTPILGLMDNADYATLLKEAKALDENTALTDYDVTIDTSKSIFEKFFSDAEQTNLTNAFYTLFSASSVYRPFSSVAGETNFSAAVKSLVQDETAYDNIMAFYSEARNYKKPLYVRDLKSDGSAKGDATRINLKEFCELVEDHEPSALVTQKGMLKKTVDTDVWQYYNTDRFTAVPAEIPSTTVEGETTDAVTEEATTKPVSADISNAQAAQLAEDYVIDMPTISNVDKMSEPIFYIGSSLSINLKMGQVLMKNMLCDIKSLQDNLVKDTSLLFVNPFGDIVTEKDVVIIPAASNPYYYADDTEYFPYTVAFMQHYPSVVPVSSIAKASSPQDVGKFLIALDKLDASDGSDVSGANVTAKNDHIAFATMLTSGKFWKILFNTEYQLVDGIQTRFVGINNAETFFYFRQYTEDKFVENLTTKTGNAYVMAKDHAASQEDSGIFTIYNIANNEENANMISTIAKIYFNFILADEHGNFSGNNGTLNEQFLIDNVVNEAMNGSLNSLVYSKDYIDDYDTYVSDSFGRFKTNLKDICDDAIARVGDMDGILGIKNVFQDNVFSSVMKFIQTYIYLILIVVFLFVIGKYIRFKYSFGFVVFATAVCVCVTYIYLSVAPAYIPSIFNAVNNNITEDLAYRSLISGMEEYKDFSYLNSDVSADGRFSMSTGSVNLYKLSHGQLEDIQLKYDIANIFDGKAYIIDEKSGLYVEGDCIKANIDRLFTGLTLHGGYFNDDGTMSYRISSDKMVSSAIDYYMPYYLLVDSFTNKLNLFSSLYQLESSSLDYGDFSKDSFLVWSYINSEVFMTPGEYDTTKFSDVTLVEELNSAFGENEDFLGLADVVYSGGDLVKNSLWYQTLEQNGYFEDEGKMYNLITYVNYNTKKFMIDNVDSFKGMSDENIIKVIGLYSNTLFNQRASTFGNYIYPLFLNYEETTLNDVILGIVVDERDMFMSNNMSISSYVVENYSALSAIGITLVIYVIYAIALVLKYIIPFMYLLLGGITVYKFLSGRDAVTTTLFGFIKICLSFMVCYILMILSLILAKGHMAGSYGTVLLFAFNVVLIFPIVISLLYCLITNPMELGNNKFNSIISDISDKVGFSNLLSSRKEGNLDVDVNVNNDYFKKYSHNSDIDSIMLSDDPNILNSTMKVANKSNVDFIVNDNQFDDYSHNG